MTDTYACGIEMFRPEGDLYEILGVSEHDTLQQCYKRGEQVDLTDPSIHYAWKALIDSDYAELYRRTRSTKALFDAGFFDDGLDKPINQFGVYDPVWPSTTYQKAFANLTKCQPFTDKLAVLLTTGGMAPIHKGHIAMMENARQELEERGYKVVGGYFAPGHDSYVGQKYGGTAAISAADRVAMVELATKDSDWLEVDPWACRYLPCEVNFTDVVRHMEECLDYHMFSAIDVFYVCGDDNAGFAAAMDNVIVVPRTAISSKLAREGDHSLLDPLVAEYFANIGKPTGNLPYLIRNEEDDAIKQWSLIVPGGMEEITARRIQLQSAVRLGIAQLFKLQGHDHKVHLLPVSEQRRAACKVINGRPVISLDPFFLGEYAIDSTRYFDIAGAQFKPLYRAERIGKPALAEQGAAIPAGKYVMVEDDTVTGGTLMSAKSVLGKDVEIEETVILSDFADYAGVDYYDVVDMRDFIFGSHCGGLSVILSGSSVPVKARAPYVLPFVSLRSRAKIPAAAEVEVSRVIWQANLRFFKDSNILIAQCDPGFQHLANNLGFSNATPMERFCRWGIDNMMESV